MAGWRQPGLIRAPPAGGRGRFEVSRCRALRPPGRPRRQAVGPGLAAGPAARVYPGAGWGLGAGILFPPGPSGTSKRSAGSEEASGWGAGLRAGILFSAGPRPPVGCPLGPLSPAPPPESALLSAHCVPGAALCSSCAYELLTLHYSYRVRRCNAPHFTGEETSSEKWRPCQTPPGPPAPGLQGLSAALPLGASPLPALGDQTLPAVGTVAGVSWAPTVCQVWGWQLAPECSLCRSDSRIPLPPSPLGRQGSVLSPSAEQPAEFGSLHPPYISSCYLGTSNPGVTGDSVGHPLSGSSQACRQNLYFKRSPAH